LGKKYFFNFLKLILINLQRPLRRYNCVVDRGGQEVWGNYFKKYSHLRKPSKGIFGDKLIKIIFGCFPYFFLNISQI